MNWTRYHSILIGAFIYYDVTPSTGNVKHLQTLYILSGLSRLKKFCRYYFNVFMAALCNRGPLYFWPVVSSFFLLFSSPNLSRRRCLSYFDTWCGLSANLECRLKRAARCSLEMQDAKNCQKFAIWAPSHNFVGLYLRNKGTYRQSEKMLSSNMSSRCPHNIVNFGALAAEIGLPVWGTPANFNGFCVLAALLHGSLVVGVTLRRWTEGATYIRQGGHHVGHWHTFLVYICVAQRSRIRLSGPTPNIKSAILARTQMFGARVFRDPLMLIASRR